MTIQEMQTESWQVAEEKGFHDDLKDTPLRTATLLRLMLVVTEVSEGAQEVKRHWQPDGPTPEQIDTFTEEMADAVIRIGDLCGTVGGDLQAAILAKMEKNRNRPQNYGTPKEEHAMHLLCMRCQKPVTSTDGNTRVYCSDCQAEKILTPIQTTVTLYCGDCGFTAPGIYERDARRYCPNCDRHTWLVDSPLKETLQMITPFRCILCGSPVESATLYCEKCRNGTIV